MDSETIAIIAGLVTIIMAILAALKWGKRAIAGVWRFIRRYKPKVPRETVRILPQVRGCRWNMGSIRGKPAMHVNGRWYVTNITGDQVFILSARLVRPPIEGDVLTRHPERNIFGHYPILPGATVEVSSDFCIIQPLRKVGEDFKAKVILTDQYGNKHKIKNVIFKGPRPKEQEKRYLAQEAIHSITDTIEKGVVAVLKAEVNRYKECGRKVGGLGSIQTIIKEHTYKGMGTEWREADSPKNQSIVDKVDEVGISSDNAKALLNLYKGTTSGDEKSRFFDALLKRLSKDKEYAPVGYLILYVLFDIGKLTQALQKAKQDLQGDDEYGFSNFLMLLDGLLRFRHPAFTYEMLDNVERFVEDLKEHTFRIKERLAAIRVFRLAKQD